MRRPLGVTAAGWFLVASGLLPILVLLWPTAPPDPKLAALAATIPPTAWFWNVIWWADSAITTVAGVLVLRGRRTGRVLCLGRGLVLQALSLRGLIAPSGFAPDMERQLWVFAAVPALLGFVIYLSTVFLLFRRPSQEWFALTPARQPLPAWSLRGVLGAMVLVAGGIALYGWLLTCLIVVAMALGDHLRPFIVLVLVFWFVPVAALLALGLAVAPGRRGKRRLAIVGLCSGLFTLFVGVLCGAAMCSPLLLSLLPPNEIPARFGPHFLLACPVLLVLLVPCGLHLRTSRSGGTASPG